MFRRVWIFLFLLGSTEGFDFTALTGDWNPQNVTASEIVSAWNETQLRLALFLRRLCFEME